MEHNQHSSLQDPDATAYKKNMHLVFLVETHRRQIKCENLPHLEPRGNLVD